MRPIAENRRDIAFNFEPNFRTRGTSSRLQLFDSRPREVDDRESLCRSHKAIGFDTRQAHQVLDDPKHPSGLGPDSLTESNAAFPIDIVIVGQGLGIAEDRCQRSPELVGHVRQELGLVGAHLGELLSLLLEPLARLFELHVLAAEFTPLRFELVVDLHELVLLHGELFLVGAKLLFLQRETLRERLGLEQEFL